MPSKLIHITLISTLILFASFFAYKSYYYSKKYEEVTLLLVKQNTLNNLASIKLKRVGNILSFGLYDGDEEFLNKRKELLEIKTYYHAKSQNYTLFFLVTVLIIALLYLYIDLVIFNITLTITALIALVVGIFAPLMMITIHKNVEILGDITLTAQSKSLTGTLAGLFDKGEFVVGGLLLLFSILLPLAKNIALIFVALFVKSPFAHSIVHFFKLMGKWSMADVFVVSTLLVFLSSNGDASSQAEIEVGLYFFITYVIISMLATLSSDKLLQITKGT